MTSINHPMSPNSSARFFVTGTDTGVGKTLISAALLHALAQRGLRTIGMKPVAAGTSMVTGRFVNEDTEVLLAASSISAPRALVTPYLFDEPAAPHLAAAMVGRSIEAAPILAAFQQLTKLADALVVEGVGGFLVPLGIDFDTADLAQMLDLPVILVVGLRLGCLNHAALTAQAVRQRGLHLAGWVANRIDPEMAHADANIATLATLLDAPLLGVVPTLAVADPKQAARHLDLHALFDSSPASK